MPEATRTALDNAVKFMRNSEPVRTLSLEELKQQDPREFGLAPPQFTIILRASCNWLASPEPMVRPPLPILPLQFRKLRASQWR